MQHDVTIGMNCNMQKRCNRWKRQQELFNKWNYFCNNTVLFVGLNFHNHPTELWWGEKGRRGKRLRWWSKPRTSYSGESSAERSADFNHTFRQHQMVGREGKGGHSFLAIDHIRDQLIPPQVCQCRLIFNFEEKRISPDNNSLSRRGVTRPRFGAKQLLISGLTRAGWDW